MGSTKNEGVWVFRLKDKEKRFEDLLKELKRIREKRKPFTCYIDYSLTRPYMSDDHKHPLMKQIIHIKEEIEVMDQKKFEEVEPMERALRELEHALLIGDDKHRLQYMNEERKPLYIRLSYAQGTPFTVVNKIMKSDQWFLERRLLQGKIIYLLDKLATTPECLARYKLPLKEICQLLLRVLEDTSSSFASKHAKGRSKSFDDGERLVDLIKLTSSGSDSPTSGREVQVNKLTEIVGRIRALYNFLQNEDDVNEIAILQADNKALDRLAKSKEYALFEAERTCEIPLAKASMADYLQNKNHKLMEQIVNIQV